MVGFEGSYARRTRSFLTRSSRLHFPRTPQSSFVRLLSSNSFLILVKKLGSLPIYFGRRYAPPFEMGPLPSTEAYGLWGLLRRPMRSYSLLPQCSFLAFRKSVGYRIAPRLNRLGSYLASLNRRSTAVAYSLPNSLSPRSSGFVRWSGRWRVGKLRKFEGLRKLRPSLIQASQHGFYKILLLEA